jgi:hypothetical protein
MIYLLMMDFQNGVNGSGPPTRVRLIGPFGKAHSTGVHDKINRWLNINNPHDNPCWQVVDLEEPVVSVEAVGTL